MLQNFCFDLLMSLVWPYFNYAYSDAFSSISDARGIVIFFYSYTRDITGIKRNGIGEKSLKEIYLNYTTSLLFLTYFFPLFFATVGDFNLVGPYLLTLRALLILT